MEFGFEYNKRNWYSEVDKPNRLVYLNLEKDDTVESVDFDKQLKGDRTVEIDQKLENFTQDREKDFFRINDIAWKLRKDEYGGGLTMKSNVDVEIDKLVVESLARMKLGEDDKDDKTKFRLGFFRLQNSWVETILGKAKISAEEYQLLTESIKACDDVTEKLKQRIEERKEELAPYKALSERGLIERYEDLKTEKPNQRIRNAIKAMTNSEYRGYVGVFGRKQKTERQSYRLEQVIAKVEAKKQRLIAKQAEYDEKIKGKRERIEKGRSDVVAAFNSRTEKLSKMMDSEFGIKLNGEEKGKLAEMLKTSDEETKVKEGVMVKGKECRSMKQLKEELGKIRKLTPAQERKIGDIYKMARDMDRKRSTIDKRLADKGLDKFNKDAVKEREKNKEAKEKWLLMFGKMMEILKRGQKYKFVFKKNTYGFKKGEEREFTVKSVGETIKLESDATDISFSRNGAEIRDKSNVVSITGKRPVTISDSVKFIESIKSVGGVNKEVPEQTQSKTA